MSEDKFFLDNYKAKLLYSTMFTDTNEYSNTQTILKLFADTDLGFEPLRA